MLDIAADVLTKVQSTPRHSRHTLDKYHQFYLIAESIELYRKHGLHPIIIDAELDNKSFRIIRKLGYGSYSTVWLAIDNQPQELVAIKVPLADYEGKADTNHEVAIYDHLESFLKTRRPTKGSQIVRLLKHFKEVGPNGTHRCLVFELMGPSCGEILDNPRDFIKGLHSLDSHHAPLWLAKRMIKSLVSGVEELHAAKVIHGDLHTGNLLSVLEKTSVNDAKALTQDRGKQRVERRDRKPVNDPRVPNYLIEAESKSMLRYLNLSKEHAAFKLADVGGAFMAGNLPAKVHANACNRAPEIVLGLSKGSYKTDIWSIGCLIYQILTGETLFNVHNAGHVTSKELIDDTMNWQVDRLGRLPEFLAEHWHQKHYYYDLGWNKIRDQILSHSSLHASSASSKSVTSTKTSSQKSRLSEEDVEMTDYADSEEETESESSAVTKVESPPKSLPSLEADFEAKCTPELKGAERLKVLRLIRSCLHYEAEKRPTAEVLTKEAWIKVI